MYKEDERYACKNMRWTNTLIENYQPRDDNEIVFHTVQYIYLRFICVPAWDVPATPRHRLDNRYGPAFQSTTHRFGKEEISCSFGHVSGITPWRSSWLEIIFQCPIIKLGPLAGVSTSRHRLWDNKADRWSIEILMCEMCPPFHHEWA